MPFFYLINTFCWLCNIANLAHWAAQNIADLSHWAEQVLMETKVLRPISLDSWIICTKVRQRALFSVGKALFLCELGHKFDPYCFHLFLGIFCMGLQWVGKLVVSGAAIELLLFKNILNSVFAKKIFVKIKIITFEVMSSTCAPTICFSILQHKTFDAILTMCRIKSLQNRCNINHISLVAKKKQSHVAFESSTINPMQ